MSLDPLSLSHRAREMLAGRSMPEYLVRHFEASANPYHPATNPAGYIGLCVAENRLVAELVASRLDEVGPVPPEVLGYDAMTGSVRFRERLCRFMGRSFLGREFAAGQIAVLAGAGSVLEILFHALGDPGDGVLVPTPSYAGFWMDLELRNRLRVVPVHTDADEGFRLTPALLDRAVEAADRPIRALLFTTPDNPLGRVYSAQQIEAIVGWAEDRDLHLVVDEIYALSVFGDRAFTSVASLRQALGDRIHIVWAFSKDFGASGLRCGVLISENEAVHAAVDTLAYWACCSGHTQHLLGELVSDDAWVDGYVDAMQRLLRGVYDRLAGRLRAGGIPFVGAGAGVFVLLDLRRYLAAPTWEAEHELWLQILGHARINLTPGAACRVGEPGFMRLCYAGLPTDTVEVGVERLIGVLRSLDR